MLGGASLPMVTVRVALPGLLTFKVTAAWPAQMQLTPTGQRSSSTDTSSMRSDSSGMVAGFPRATVTVCIDGAFCGVALRVAMPVVETLGVLPVRVAVCALAQPSVARMRVAVATRDRQSVVLGRSVSVRVVIGG